MEETTMKTVEINLGRVGAGELSDLLGLLLGGNQPQPELSEEERLLEAQGGPAANLIRYFESGDEQAFRDAYCKAYKLEGEDRAEVDALSFEEILRRLAPHVSGNLFWNFSAGMYIGAKLVLQHGVPFADLLKLARDPLFTSPIARLEISRNAFGVHAQQRLDRHAELFSGEGERPATAANEVST